MNEIKVQSIHQQLINASHVYSKHHDDFISVEEWDDVTNNPSNVVISFKSNLTGDFIEITESGLDSARLVKNKLYIFDVDGKEQIFSLFLLKRVDIKLEWIDNNN
jgi:hypothetical protein